MGHLRPFAYSNPYAAPLRRAEELLDEANPNFNPLVDPKCSWALNHPEFFPVEVNRADYEALLRIPGVGVVSAKRILVSRRARKLRIEDLQAGVVMKRAQYFSPPPAAWQTACGSHRTACCGI